MKTRGKKCIQFTDEPSGTVYVLRVINDTSITFEVSYVISDKIITNEFKEYLLDLPFTSGSLCVNLN